MSGKIFESYRYLSHSRSPEELGNRIEKILRALGFSDFIYLRMGRQSDVYATLTSLDATLLDIYFQNGLHRHDVMLRYCLENTSPTLLSSIQEYLFSAPFTTESIEKNRAIRALIERFEYADFYGIPVPHATTDNALFAVGAKQVDKIEVQRLVNAARGALSLLGRAIDHIGANRFPRYFLRSKDRSPLNPRPLLLLTLIATENMTIAEAAHKMGISLHTANKQMAAAKQALGATTQASAVYLAMKEGLIARRA